MTITREEVERVASRAENIAGIDVGRDAANLIRRLWKELQATKRYEARDKTR